MDECLEENTVLDFLAGRLANVELSKVEHHLDRCETCRTIVAGARSRESENPGLVRPPIAIGEVVDEKYVVERVLGQGGMGMVVLARHIELERKVAIKVLREGVLADESTLERFLQEAKSLALLTNDHVVHIHDVGRLASGVPYMVMEYLRGTDLAAEVKSRRRLEPSEVVRHLLAACEGLGEAHAAGIVHRDLKPGNLFLAEEHDKKRVLKIIDFGIAKSLTQKSRLTADWMILGSPQYISPEQLSTPRDVDARADIWALGAIAFRLLAGRTPFENRDLESALTNILENKRPPLLSLCPELDPLLAATVERCLSRDRDQRFASVEELSRALREVARPSVVSIPPPPRRIGAPAWKIAGVAGTVLVLAVIVLVVSGGLGALTGMTAASESLDAPLPAVDPKRADVTDVAAACRALAKKLDPNAELVGIDAVKPLANGVANLEAGETLLFTYEGEKNDKTGMISVEVTATRIEGTRLGFPRWAKPLADPRCSIKDAFRAAVNAGVPADARAEFEYGREPGIGNWSIDVPGRPELAREVDGATCKVVAIQKR